MTLAPMPARSRNHHGSTESHSRTKRSNGLAKGFAISDWLGASTWILGIHCHKYEQETILITVSSIEAHETYYVRAIPLDA